MESIDHLRKEIAQREAELAELKSQLAKAESQSESEVARRRDTDESSTWRWPLEEVEYERYSRQMIVPKFGLPGTTS
jgi:adenylyltransferase and sulfurtransferase